MASCYWITGDQESNFDGEFKLWTYNNLSLKICCKNIVDIVALFLK